ncbi:MAG: class I SAM-dependent methyltransferase [Solirubrobacteraceae bacterium]
MTDAVIWHDVECGSYRQDLSLWLALAAERGGPVLDVGAGTGRVALTLARAGFEVTALDRDADLLAELERRAAGLPLRTAAGDARAFELGERFPLVIVPMQTVQLLGGLEGRRAFLTCARGHLLEHGVLAVAIATRLECFELDDGEPGPLPDVSEHDGFVYFSQPTAVRRDGDAFVLARRRETVSPAGERVCEQDTIRLDRVTVRDLQAEAKQAGLRPLAVRRIPPTDDHVGSEVVMLGA